MKAAARWVLGALVLAVAATACGDAFFFEPAAERVPVTLSYHLSPEVRRSTSQASDFDAADRARIRIEAEADGRALFDGTVGLEPAGTDKRATVQVPVGDEEIVALVEVELLVDGEPVLGGAGSLIIVPGAEDPASTSITLTPVSGGTGTAVVQGTVVDASTNSPLGNVRVQLLSGFDATSGSTPVAETTTDASGNFRLPGLDAGRYTLVASSGDFITARQNIELAAGQTVTRTIALSTQLGAGQTRIVLTWDADPGDLDSHITGPDGQGGTFHVYFSNTGSRDTSPFTSLDVDVTTGFGPETVTIWQQFSGTYCYSVDVFSGTGDISTSGATVEVFQGGSRVAAFQAPSTAGTLWTVFSLDSGGITRIDRVTDNVEPGVCG